jgi:hypothetical protein
MVTNPNSPFGFVLNGNIDGSPPNFGNRQGLIASANTNKIFKGDVLKPLAVGYLDVAAEVGGGESVGGVAEWFEWNSISQQKHVRQNWWTGAGDATGDVLIAYDGNLTDVFLCQCLLGPVTQANVGSNANFNIGAGGRTVGTGNQSSFTLDDGTLGAGAALPFKVYRLPVPTTGPGGSLYVLPGQDPTNPYNQVYVTFNNLVA